MEISSGKALKIYGPTPSSDRKSLPIVTKTGDYTATDLDHTILADGTSNTVTITLPAGVSGRTYTIKCIDNTFQVDIDPDGTEEIDGDSANFVLNL